MTDDDVPFGALLRRLRLAADLTLEQLADASGVSDRGISDMERGVSRSPRTRTIEAIADGLRLGREERDRLLAAARAGRVSPAPVAGLPLPRRVSDFTGREAELARIARWTAGSSAAAPAPVVVVSGPPGVGKTSLAVQAAQAWPAEQHLFVDLRGLDDKPLTPAAVLGKLIRALSPEQHAVPRDLDEAAALWQTLSRDRRLVVVLDNAIGEAQVRPVLPPHGPAVVLVTSRRALSGLEGVRRLRLDALSETDAVALLGAILDDPQASRDSLRRIAELCVRVPLALRIAGNRLLSRPGWTPGDLIARLAAQERRLDALAAGDLQVKAAFNLSYQQLSGVARRLFRRLALVPGPSAGVELASVLAQEPIAVTEDALDELIELSLLQQRPDGRLEFHDLLRLYAQGELEREEGAADRAAAVRRRDDWLLDTAMRAGLFFEPGQVAPAGCPFTTGAEAGDWLRREAENWLPALQSAAAAGQDQRVVEVADSLHWFSDGWANWPHWLDVFSLSAGAARKLGDDRLTAIHLGYLAWVHIVCLGQPEIALERAREALDHATRSGDRKQIAWAHYYIGWALSRLRRWDDVLTHAREAVAGFRAVNDREGLPNGLTLCALAVQGRGPADEAIPLYEQVIEAVTDPATAPPAHIALFIETVSRSFLANIEIAAERWPQALRRVDESVAAAERLEHSLERLMTARSQRALVFARLGRMDQAREELAAVRVLLERNGNTEPRPGALRDRLTEVESILAAYDAQNSSM
ncbi:helix-turn-helix domain-containing protein [Paractinoplanes atraurantiacus]|uniref:AAA ATPase domain-containing protein n=1 Tax=Paractinoplanes atraurantiacus TaxID=1036182 RepID=A0A285K434_9ACTN|nr:helix-turn-helix domain-containing protein [Actinoplanes atraurantiacus]SNY67350.1 AAA ATPase domain-containing protein [Actinoplanes atraurantiacus]